MYFLDINKKWLIILSLPKFAFAKRFSKIINFFWLIMMILVYAIFDEEKNNFAFTCTFCNSFNKIDFDTICNQYTARMLKCLTIDRQIQEKVNEILQIKLIKLKIQEI